MTTAIGAVEQEAEQTLAERVLRDSCPVRRSFIQRPAGSTELTPLTRLLRTREEAGGKGAGLRIALLLSLIWVASKEPYTTRRGANYWATLLEKDDPSGEGGRLIRDCLHELRERKLISVQTHGPRVEVALHREDSGQGLPPRPYRPPHAANEPYISVPRTYWTSGLAGELSGAGAAMYLVALALTRHEQPVFFISAETFDARYGISRSSRKRGLAELVQHGVLTVKQEAALDIETFRTVRRNFYTVEEAFRQPAAKEAPDKSETDAATKDAPTPGEKSIRVQDSPKKP